MSLESDLFSRTRADSEKLIQFGFAERENGYVYERMLHAGMKAVLCVDENGHITAYSCGTSDPDGKIEKENAERRAKEDKEEKKLAEKKRAEKKAEERRAENRRIKKENIIKESPEEINITVIGTDIKEMTLQLTERMTLSSGSAAGATSFDLKA